MKDFKDLETYIEAFHEGKKQNKLDLSTDQDVAMAVMNLIAAEEHLFFTGAKTKKTSYYDMIEPIRDIRKNLLKKIIKDYEGEVWCTSKHLLTSSMRMMEVGTKELSDGKKESAYDFFNKSYDLYMMFWILNINKDDNVQAQIMEKIETIKENVKNMTSETINKISFDFQNIKKNLKKEPQEKGKEEGKKSNSDDGIMGDFKSKFSKMKDFISEKLNCCKE